MPENRTPPRYRRRRRRRSNGPVLIAVLAAILVVLIGVAIWVSGLDSEPAESTGGSTGSTAGSSQSTSPTASSSTATPTEPPVTKLSTATISNTGDFLMHMGVTNSGYHPADGSYSYESIFTYFADYVKQADYAVANFETTTYGPDWKWYYSESNYGTGYSGFPWFNSPDGIVTSLKEAGFDMMLAANNHIYDTRETGFLRTQQVFKDNGLDWLGIIPDSEQTLWKIREVNGIKLGMVCYTYADHRAGGKISLNGNSPMSDATSSLISTFSYDYLEEFYTEMQQNIAAMEAAGAEAVVLYIHWGNEYRLTESVQQNQIAQKMCDLGVDVIVGGHPHVVQPMELLSSTVDPDQKTVCIYSLGNAVSNQRDGLVMNGGYTEDGVLFSFTFAKYSDGTVILESAEILPLWVNMYYSAAAGRNIYEILPLDKQVADWKTQFNLSDSTYSKSLASYERTMGIIGGGLEEIQQYLAQQLAQTEANLGMQ